MPEKPNQGYARLTRVGFLGAIVPLYLVAWVFSTVMALGPDPSPIPPAKPGDLERWLARVPLGLMQVPLVVGIIAVTSWRLRDIGRGGWLAGWLVALVLLPVWAVPLWACAWIVVKVTPAGTAVGTVYMHTVELSAPSGIGPVLLLAASGAGLLAVIWLAITPGMFRRARPAA